MPRSKSQTIPIEAEVNVDELPPVDEVEEPVLNDEEIVVIEEPESETEQATRPHQTLPDRRRRVRRWEYSLRHAKNRQTRNRSERVRDLNFNDRLAAIGIRHLYTKDIHANQTYEISLSTLQRMVMHDLQRRLVDLVSYMVRQQEISNRNMEDARRLLSQYTTVVRDYDFIIEKLSQTQKAGEEDLFSITTKNILGFQLLKDARLLPSTISSRKQSQRISAIRSNILPGTSRNEHNDITDLARLLERLWMGILGGLALIGPMLLMVLHKDLLTTLVTVSVATLLFAMTLALLGTELRGETVLASVAAYAAVLVVFVGTSS